MDSSLLPPPSPLPAPQPLAALASQHHASDYNRLKFGPAGCPVPYQPLSIQQPDYFDTLRLHQLAFNAHTQPWWPANPNPAIPVYGPRGASDPVLHHQLLAAIDEPLFASPAQPPHPLKTSATHPINISSIIPLDLLPFLSSHALLRPRPDHVPTVLDIPPSLTLDRLALPRMRTPRHTLPLPSHLPPLLAPPPIPAPPTPPHVSTRATITEALHAAINTAIASSPDLPKMPSPPLTGKRKRTLTTTPSRHPKSALVTDIKLYAPLDPPSAPPFAIGNLFMSSCPGKKVRLQGPVRGRSGVCRDLKTDLNRMKDLGVGCVVCCLDDEELQFLGAPWPEYKQHAHDIGIDVLRIPAPEGLPPVAPSVLDTYLTDIIDTYTLHGIPVLVHCRGGVGRAGVFACCWLIKLGLCGWLETDTSPALLLVRKVIDLVRNRRSLKAIETYEQVHFLVDFVEHLRSSVKTP